MNRSRGSRVLKVTVLLACLVAGAVLTRLASYSFGGLHNRFNPASLAGESPTCFYLDWSGDLPGPRDLRSRLAPDSVFFLSRLEVTRDGRLRHDPLVVIQAALALHDRLLRRRDPESDVLFRRQLDWLVNDAALALPDSVVVWPQYYRAGRYGLHDRWISALTQGQAISLLVRAASYTGRREYLDVAARAVRAFTRSRLPIVWHGPDGALFLEEYPCTPPAHVLNGALIAWLGPWDYQRATHDPAVRDFCLRSIESMAATLPRYEMGDWTRYDVLEERPTSPRYQEIHGALAETLAHIFPADERWRTRAARWNRAAADPWQRAKCFVAVGWSKLAARVKRTGGPAPQGLLLGEDR